MMYYVILVANFLRFSAVKKFENRLKFDKVRDKKEGFSLFLAHSVCGNDAFSDLE